MSTTLEVRHVSVSIERSPDEVYRLASDVQSWPRWAHGLGTVKRRGDEWIAEGPIGTAKVRFSPRNEFHVLDHDVTLASGVTVHNALRVIPNGGGSEVVFSVLRQPGTSSAYFQADTQAVERDLQQLKQIVEGRQP